MLLMEIPKTVQSDHQRLISVDKQFKHITLFKTTINNNNNSYINIVKQFVLMCFEQNNIKDFKNKLDVK